MASDSIAARLSVNRAKPEVTVDSPSMAAALPSCRTAILVKRFPKLSETFILGEVGSLLDDDAQMRIVSIHHPNETKRHPGSERFLARTDYLPQQGAFRSFIASAGFMLRHPRRVLPVLLDMLRGRLSGVTLLKLIAICRRHDIGHIHAHYLSEPAALAAACMRVLGGTYSVSAHAKDIYLTAESDVRARVMGAEFVASCTAYNVDHLRRLVPERARHVHLIYHGVDTQRFQAPVQRCAPDPPLIIAVGRFKAKKGFDVLIDACRALDDRGHAFQCEIIGYGEERERLAQRVVAQGLGASVRLLDPLDHDEIAEKLKQARVFVLPCRIPPDGDRDGIPNAVLEAMAAELPVVSTSVSGIPEVIESGHNGLLVEPDNAAALANAITALLTNPDLAAELGRQARATVIRNFCWHRNIGRLQDLFDTVASGRAAGGDRSVAYILKGYPRLSESFIANEVRLLERMGLPLRIFSIKRGDPIIDPAEFPRAHYLPSVGSMSNTGLFAWLRGNASPFVHDQWRCFAAHPLRYCATLIFAVHSAYVYADGATTRFKKTFIKEFLFATYIAARINKDPRVVHIHAHFCHDATSVAWMVSRLCGRPFSFTAHAKDIYQKRLNPGTLLTRKLEAATFAVTCTLTNVAYLRERCSRPEKIHGNYHGLDIELFKPPERAAAAAAKLVAVGRMVEKKGFIYLIEACRLLRLRGVQFKLDIIGEAGDQTPLLENAIIDADLQELVRLCAPVKQAELVQYYASAAAFVLPCVVLDDGDRDGIPNVMAEAMACGLPVVVSSVSGIPELVTHGENGLLVAPRDSEALAAALELVLSDPERAKRLGQAGRATIESVFDAERTHEALKALFDETLKEAVS